MGEDSGGGRIGEGGGRGGGKDAMFSHLISALSLCGSLSFTNNITFCASFSFLVR